LQKPTAHAACDIVQRVARSGLLDLAKLEFRITNDHVSNALALRRGRSKSVSGSFFSRCSIDGEEFGRLAVTVSERHGFTAPRAGAQFLMQMAVLWTRPIENALTCLEAAARSARETGEMVYACYTRQHRVTDLMARGDPLDQIWRESVAALDFVRKYKFGQVVILSIQDFVQSLRGQTRGADPVDGAALEARVLRSGVAVVACFHRILQLQRHFLLGDPDTALEFAERAKPLLWSVRFNIQSVDYCFYYALALAAVFPAAPPGRQTELREALAANLRTLQRWAESCPESFSHKHDLVAAEAARLEGREMEAMRLYEQAIRSAGANGFIQNEAIAYEIAARFYAVRGFDKIADAYLLQARSGFVRWGAEAKVRQLDKQHPQLQQERLVASSTSMIAVPVEQLDLATVIKVSQSVSGELVLEKLIDRLVRAAIEHAGAQRGLMISPRNDELHIEAEAITRGEDLTVHLGGGADTAAALPESIVKYVMRAQETVILDDALSKNPFSADPYVAERRARSILCLPLITQGKLIGILYLENNLAPHVFNAGRVTVLKVLASQAATSLENTRLYRDLAEREAELAHVSRVTTLGQLTASIAHEVKQPIAAARNNARAALNFLDRRPPDFGEVREALDCIVGDTDRAADIIDRIRDHIKKAPPQKEHFDLNEAINEVLVLARSAISKNGVSVQTPLTERVLPVEGDRVQLQQVVLNLVLNAVEAMGSVQEGPRELSISTEQDHTGVLVAVRDSGPGIDPEHAEGVFDAFYTTKSSGLGMGLSICRSIIDAHGGRLWVNANEPRGAVFQFNLPSA
jgi:signal transduction histidine kinase